MNELAIMFLMGWLSAAVTIFLGCIIEHNSVKRLEAENRRRETEIFRLKSIVMKLEENDKKSKGLI